MSSSEEEQKLLELIKDLERFSREVRFPSGLNIFEAAGVGKKSGIPIFWLFYFVRKKLTDWALSFSGVWS
jgi:hypothetical protein